MRLFKKINNNFALALDSKGEEVIVSGKGIGFYKMPCYLENMEIITRTYYDIDNKYLGLLSEIPEEIINISVKVSDFAKRKIETEFNPNIIFTLADHINFSIERLKKGHIFDFPTPYDFEEAYKEELLVGKYALDLIKEKLNIHLPQSEVIGIALNIVNSKSYYKASGNVKNYDNLVTSITEMIEVFFEREIDKSTLNFSRFSTHLRYLFKRMSEQKAISSDNYKIFETMKKETPKTYESIQVISEYLFNTEGWTLDQEEQLYLILHVNRLLSREDCNREGITLDT